MNMFFPSSSWILQCLLLLCTEIEKEITYLQLTLGLDRETRTERIRNDASG